MDRVEQAAVRGGQRRPEHHTRAADDQVAPQRPPVAAVEGVLPVVAHHEVAACGNDDDASGAGVDLACSTAAGIPAAVPVTEKTGIFCCRPLSANSPRASVSKLPITRSSVFCEMTTCPGLATPLSRREAMLTELPSTV